MTRRLIEDWLPIAALGEESVRERRSMTALPPTYYLHVWWARRPLIASRAAVLASLLPSDADHEKFLHMLGIHGDPIAARKLIGQAIRTGMRVDDPYGYPRAFGYLPNLGDYSWLKTEISRTFTEIPKVLDPTSGGGSIPFESVRLMLNTYGNDLNPVSVIIQRATVDWPLRLGISLQTEYIQLAAKVCTTYCCSKKS
jgi:putative DNA methylase